MERQKIIFPCDRGGLEHLRAGDGVSLSGVVYTARDAAHQRICQMIGRGEPLPLDFRNQAIYYAGPAPTRPGKIIGPIGPTTSGRMDSYTPELLDLGVTGLIGKGTRSAQVCQSLQEHGAVYFGATGGAAALLSEAVINVTVVAFEDLGTEAVRRLEVRDFPLVVVVDSRGNDLYSSGPAQYRR